MRQTHSQVKIHHLRFQIQNFDRVEYSQIYDVFVENSGFKREFRGQSEWKTKWYFR